MHLVFPPATSYLPMPLSFRMELPPGLQSLLEAGPPTAYACCADELWALDGSLWGHGEAALGRLVPGPKQEMLGMRQGRHLEGGLLGLQALAGEMGLGQGQSHGAHTLQGHRPVPPAPSHA